MRNNNRRHWIVSLLLVGICPLLIASGRAQDETSLLSETQSQITNNYAEIEMLMLRMAQFDQAKNPRRSELLKQAFALSKDRDIQIQLEAIVRSLEKDRLRQAIDGQRQAQKDMEALLELLQSENRSDRLKDEQARIRDYIREVERLERMQRSVRSRTEGGLDAKTNVG